MKAESLHTQTEELYNNQSQEDNASLVDFFVLLIEADLENQKEGRFSIIEEHSKKTKGK